MLGSQSSVKQSHFATTFYSTQIAYTGGSGFKWEPQLQWEQEVYNLFQMR